MALESEQVLASSDISAGGPGLGPPVLQRVHDSLVQVYLCDSTQCQNDDCMLILLGAKACMASQSLCRKQEYWAHLSLRVFMTVSSSSLCAAGHNASVMAVRAYICSFFFKICSYCALLE